MPILGTCHGAQGTSFTRPLLTEQKPITQSGAALTPFPLSTHRSWPFSSMAWDGPEPCATARGIQRACHQPRGTPQKESLLISQRMRIPRPFPPPPCRYQASAAPGRVLAPLTCPCSDGCLLASL